LGGLERGPGLGERRRGGPESTFGVEACGGLLAGGLRRRRLRPLAAVERVVEREAIVTLLNRSARVRERAFGRGQLVVRVIVGARGAGGVDGALCLLDFALRRIVAACDCQRRHNEKACKIQTTTAQGHSDKYTCSVQAISVTRV